MIPDEVLESDIAAIAQKGAGKTYLMKGLVERNLRAGRRTVVIDPLGVWWGLKVLASLGAGAAPHPWPPGSRGGEGLGEGERGEGGGRGRDRHARGAPRR